ncbi:hypothetical protein [Nocardia ninae]|uniref:Uncharacterized protein n=1 Tax=Nocardia ninae NBRC 108245 TaxID=1210091 RepID=A0A511MNJ4_9NOCA|nr:hypothetical protein [Nocardia ninae]GEM42184.1 hypothetical protein NN4_67030 [Nocardia ninae NBRC 108245]
MKQNRKTQRRRPAQGERRRAMATAPAGSTGRDRLVLAAETPTEFIALLRRIQKASGLTPGQVAAYTGIPRSTAYHFISPKNTALPSNGAQVEAFLRGCRLSEDQIQAVLRIWTKLSGLPIAPAPRASLETSSQVPEVRLRRDGRSDAEMSLAAENYIQEVMRGPRIQWVGPDFGGAGARMPVDVPTVERQGGNINIVYTIGDKQGTLSARTLPRTGRFRRDVLVLMVVALYPVAATMFLGPPRTATMYTVFFTLALIGLLVGVFPWWGKLPATVAPQRFTVSALLGAGAGLLTWHAIGLAFIGLLTGFIIFAAAPMWFATMEATWTAPFISTRAIVTIVVAAWFGIITGGLIITTGGAPAGAILAGALALAAVLMETAARTMPLRETAAMH